MKNVEVSFNKSNESILNLLENQGLNIETNCRDGFCGACNVKVLSGSVRYDDEPIGHIQEGHVLACCAKPNNKVIIQVRVN